jgi:hypothetical protein
MASLQKIDHIVVLMLENRSFDSLLGTLYPKSDSFEGLNGTEQNPDANGTPVVVWNSPGADETTMRIPNPDPGELWTDINMQLFGNPAPAPGQRPTMVGFVQNYLAQRQQREPSRDDLQSRWLLVEDYIICPRSRPLPGRSKSSRGLCISLGRE